MGFSLAWLAIRGKQRSEILDVLCLEDTGAREDIAESTIVGAMLPHGWYMVIDQSKAKVVDDKLLLEITRGCEAVECFVEEHVMCSFAAGWNNGINTWSVIHEADQGGNHLETKGSLPKEFESIRKKLTSEQEQTGNDEVDYIFDVPVELAEQLTGYRHDRDVPGLDKNAFEVLKYKSGPKPWWKIW